jgi:hypothetical protein
LSPAYASILGKEKGISIVVHIERGAGVKTTWQVGVGNHQVKGCAVFKEQGAPSLVFQKAVAQDRPSHHLGSWPGQRMYFLHRQGGHLLGERLKALAAVLAGQDPRPRKAKHRGGCG